MLKKIQIIGGPEDNNQRYWTVSGGATKLLLSIGDTERYHQYEKLSKSDNTIFLYVGITTNKDGYEEVDA